jgi:hypothetical protein
MDPFGPVCKKIGRISEKEKKGKKCKKMLDKLTS